MNTNAAPELKTSQALLDSPKRWNDSFVFRCLPKIACFLLPKILSLLWTVWMAAALFSAGRLRSASAVQSHLQCAGVTVLHYWRVWIWRVFALPVVPPARRDRSNHPTS